MRPRTGLVAWVISLLLLYLQYLTAELAPGFRLEPKAAPTIWGTGLLDRTLATASEPRFQVPRFPVVDRATVKMIGDKLREQLPPPDTKASKELRRLLVKLERRAREQNNEREPNRKSH